MTLIREIFVSDVTRDIPPVVFFGEQSPAKIQAEVSEYIITGGFEEGDPRKKRVPDGIHEQYVRLLTGVTEALAKKGGPDLPTAWISGFYGSGKSSFAKLLGLALDGEMVLPDGRTVAAALLERDLSPKRKELEAAWAALRTKIDPIAVVFDVGSKAGDGQQVHSVAVQEVQRRLGYASYPLVADFELRLENEQQWEAFEAAARDQLGKPWAEMRTSQFVEDAFSVVLSKLYPDRYPEPMTWIESRAGYQERSAGPEDAAKAIRDMLHHRAAGKTLFVVADEVSQYVLGHQDRVDRLRAFATALGAVLKGKAWLFALGQQQIDDQAGDMFLSWAKDRFPPRLRVHLAPTNIRDVVYQRLLRKTADGEARLRTLFDEHRPSLKLYAYGCESVTPEEFVEVYPLLPGQIDLVLQITTALRTRSSRAQGDDQAIRGLLQLLGELFRAQALADQELGSLVTLDQVYEVQHTALDADTQTSMARILDACAERNNPMLLRAAKAVALLELIQDVEPTTAKLVSQCLYDRVDRGNQLQAVTDALEALRRDNLLGYSEKEGYRIQSSAGEEWERERREIGVSREAISEMVADALKYLMDGPDQPVLQGRKFPWAAVVSDGRRLQDHRIKDPRAEADIKIDFRFLVQEQRGTSQWIKLSDEAALRDRLVWVVGEARPVDDAARELARSKAMVRKYQPRKESLPQGKKVQLLTEEGRVDDLDTELRRAVEAAFMAGQMYFRGRAIEPSQMGNAFSTALLATGVRHLPDLYPHFEQTQVAPSELMQLLELELTGPSSKFLGDHLGILELDNNRYHPACSGVVPRRIIEHIDGEGGVSGASLIAHFGAPPYGYPVTVVKACVAGLLRAGRIKIQTDTGAEITAVRDADVRELFDKDRPFRRANLFPSGEDGIGPQARARICKFFSEKLNQPLDRDDSVIADAAGRIFPQQNKRLLDVIGRLRQIPGAKEPEVFGQLADVLEKVLSRIRQTKPTVQLIKQRLDVLNDAIPLLGVYDADLNEAAIDGVRRARSVLDRQVSQLREAKRLDGEVAESAERVEAELQHDRPWQSVATLEGDLDRLHKAYQEARQAVLAEIGEQAEAARSQVKSREGFATLTNDQSHAVLRPIALAEPNTTVEAVAPGLVELENRFKAAIGPALEEANALLDELIADKVKVQRVNLELNGREVSTEAEVEALAQQIRERLMPLVKEGIRVRLR